MPMKDCLLIARAGKVAKNNPNPPITMVTGPPQATTLLLAPGQQPPPNRSKRLPLFAVVDDNDEETSDQTPLHVKRARAQSSCLAQISHPNNSFFNSHSVFDINDGDLCAQYLQGIATSADRRAIADQDFEEMLNNFFIHQAKAIASLSTLMPHLRAGPPAIVELEALRQEVTSLRQDKNELQNSIAKLSAQSSPFEKRVEILEAELKRSEEQRITAAEKFSGAKAAGYREGLEKFPFTEQGEAYLRQYMESEKAKFLKSGEFLDHLTIGALQYLKYGFNNCQKQAEEQGFIGKLGIDIAVENAPELEGWESNTSENRANPTAPIVGPPRNTSASPSPVRGDAVNEIAQSMEQRGDETRGGTPLCS